MGYTDCVVAVKAGMLKVGVIVCVVSPQCVRNGRHERVVLLSCIEIRF